MRKGKKKHKLERPIKAYALDQCALYKIKGLQQLSNILLWPGTPAQLEAFAERKTNYRVFLHKKTGRIIQHPKLHLDLLQSRIATLLRRVAPPNYRHSGVRDRTFYTNAEQHKGETPTIKADVAKFYPSTRFQHVFRFFSKDLKCSSDVSMLLTKLCCYDKKHIPTGARHSEVLSFYCHKHIFDKINDRARARNGVMTSYIDDITVTMNGASHGDLGWIEGQFAKQGLKANTKKSRVFRKRQPKLITGVVHNKGHQMAPNRQHEKALNRLIAMEFLDRDSPEYRAEARSLVGHLDHIALIDKRFSNRARGNRNRLRKSLVVS